MSRTNHVRQARKSPDHPERHVSLSTIRGCHKEYLGGIARFNASAARFDFLEQIDETLGEKEREASAIRCQQALDRRTEDRAKHEAEVWAEIEAMNRGLNERFETDREIDKIGDSIDRLHRLRIEIRTASDRRHGVIFRIVADANLHLGYGWDACRAIREIYYVTSDNEDRDAA